MTTEDKITRLLNKAVETVKRESFIKQYQDKATIEECLGIAISKYLQWDSRIFKAFYEALEDANFHKEAAEIEEKYAKYFPNQNGKEEIKNGTGLQPENLTATC